MHRLLVLALLAGCAKAPTAVVETELGRFEIALRKGKAAEEFAALAAGKKPWIDPKTREVRYAPYYDGLEVIRVIPGFVIQTADRDASVQDAPEGTRFDKAGLVGFSNEGAGTAKGGIFITLGPAPVLDGRHGIIGEVTAGLDVARRLSEVPRAAGDAGGDRPLKPLRFDSVTVR